MAADMAVVSMLLLYVAVSMVSACVPPKCTYKRPEEIWDLNNPWLIAIIVVSCLFFLIILLVMLWFCCYCYYRNNGSAPPRVVRRIVRVKRPVKQECKQPRILQIVPPPEPPTPPPPQRQIVVVPPPCPEPPKSLLLTVSEGIHAGGAGPDMTTRVDKPLTFTLTPQPDGIRQSAMRVHDHGSVIQAGQIDCNCYGAGCDCAYE